MLEDVKSLVKKVAIRNSTQCKTQKDPWDGNIYTYTFTRKKAKIHVGKSMDI